MQTVKKPIKKVVQAQVLNYVVYEIMIATSLAILSASPTVTPLSGNYNNISFQTS